MQYKVGYNQYYEQKSIEIKKNNFKFVLSSALGGFLE